MNALYASVKSALSNKPALTNEKHFNQKEGTTMKTTTVETRKDIKFDTNAYLSHNIHWEAIEEAEYFELYKAITNEKALINQYQPDGKENFYYVIEDGVRKDLFKCEIKVVGQDFQWFKNINLL